MLSNDRSAKTVRMRALVSPSEDEPEDFPCGVCDWAGKVFNGIEDFFLMEPSIQLGDDFLIEGHCVPHGLLEFGDSI